jgi:hypothetical protein
MRSFNTILRRMPSICSGVSVRPVTGGLDDFITRLGFRFGFSGASGINSGSLLNSVTGRGCAFPDQGSTQPGPASHRHSCRRPGHCGVNSGPSHYAAKRVKASTALRAESEDQSRRLDKANYSGQDARRVSAGDQSSHSTREPQHGCY